MSEKKEPQVCDWCLTDWNSRQGPLPKDDDTEIRYFVRQRERAPSTGRLHWQCFVIFKRSKRASAVKEYFDIPDLHIEPRKGPRDKAREYCMVDEWNGKPKGQIPDTIMEFGEWKTKQGARTDLLDAKLKIQSHKRLRDALNDDDLVDVVAKYPRFVETMYSLRDQAPVIPNITLIEWQLDVLRLLQEPPVHRRIIWIWSSHSNTGKTTFGQYLSTIFDILPASGKLHDILYLYDGQDVIWFDYTRAEEGFESYKTLESLSNHSYQVSTKYVPTKKYIKTHIMVTSNHPPDENKLPQRFLIYQIPDLDNTTTTSTSNSSRPGFRINLTLDDPYSQNQDEFFTNVEDI